MSHRIEITDQESKASKSFVHSLLALIITRAEALPITQRYLLAESCRDAADMIEQSVTVRDRA